MANKKLVSLFLMFAMVLLTFSPSFSFASNGPTTVTTTFVVQGTAGESPSSQGAEGLVNTGINLIPGASVLVTATGFVVWQTGDGTGGCSSASDPNGVGTSSHNSCGYVGPQTAGSDFLAPVLVSYSLIGQAGSGSYFQLGTTTTIVGQSGTLYLGFNDNYYQDNTQGYTVTITYTCYPGNGFGNQNHMHCGPPGQS